MASIATPEFLVELGCYVTDEIPKLVGGSMTNSLWTAAVYEVLREFALRKHWKIFPQYQPCKGEYLCDFTLFEGDYACRIACESQWAYWNGDCDWAFHKLKGVKADVKLFIFESTLETFDKIREKHLKRFAQLSPEEGFVFLRYSKGRFERAWWKPTDVGLQDDLEFHSF